MQQSLWNYKLLNKELSQILKGTSERDLLNLIHNNSFLLYDLYSRKYGIQPAFHEVSFGGKFKCDFVWLNDNSDGPEWVIVEIEQPNMRLFNKDKSPSSELCKAIEQVKSWQRYFDKYPNEKQRIFGVVGRFRFILVAGNKDEWESKEAIDWRLYNNKHYNIEIRSSDVFNRALHVLKEDPSQLWSFQENPTTLDPSKLDLYITNDEYLNKWTCFLNGK